MALDGDRLTTDMNVTDRVNMNSSNVAAQVSAIQAEAIANFVKSAKITIPKGTTFSLGGTPLPLDEDVIINNCIS